MKTFGYALAGIGLILFIGGLAAQIGGNSLVGISGLSLGIIFALVGYDRGTDSRRGDLQGLPSAYSDFVNGIPEIMRPGSAAQQIQQLRQEEANKKR